MYRGSCGAKVIVLDDKVHEYEGKTRNNEENVVELMAIEEILLILRWRHHH